MDEIIIFSSVFFIGLLVSMIIFLFYLRRQISKKKETKGKAEEYFTPTKVNSKLMEEGINSKFCVASTPFNSCKESYFCIVDTINYMDRSDSDETSSSCESQEDQAIDKCSCEEEITGRNSSSLCSSLLIEEPFLEENEHFSSGDTTLSIHSISEKGPIFTTYDQPDTDSVHGIKKKSIKISHPLSDSYIPDTVKEQHTQSQSFKTVKEDIITISHPLSDSFIPDIVDLVAQPCDSCSEYINNNNSSSHHPTLHVLHESISDDTVNITMKICNHNECSFMSCSVLS